MPVEDGSRRTSNVVDVTYPDRVGDAISAVGDGGSIPMATRGRMPFLTPAITLLFSLVGLWMGDPREGLALISVTSCLFAMTVTIRRAGPYLPPSSIYFVASGVFVGGAGYYLLLIDSSPVPIDLIRDGAGLAMITNAAIAAYITASALRSAIAWPGPHDRVSARGLHRPPFMLLAWGIVVVASSQVPLVNSIIGATAHFMGVGGLLMVVTWAAARRADQRWFGDAVLMSLVFLLPLAWIKATFVLGGRLMLAGLLIAAFSAWNLFGPSKVQKAILICCIPLFLLFSGLNRAESGDEDASVSSSNVIAEGNGLESVYSPLETWARMIGPLEVEQRQMLMPRWGETFFNAAVLPIPRSLWEDKPIGFGAELTPVFEPQLVDDNHSMAALTQGEWYANFGYLGLPAMVIVTGWLLVRLDRWHARLAWSAFEDERDWWSLATLVCLVSALGELYWVGTFTAVARGGMATLAVLLTRLVALRRHGSPSRRQPAKPSMARVDSSSTSSSSPLRDPSNAWRRRAWR